MKHADPDWRPIIPEWDDINVSHLGLAVHDALIGKRSPEQALADVVPRVAEIMKNGGYLKD
ncbi:MAG: hypothetical protein Q7R40_14165 [Phaeospirillum sp.]|nr:hypothetical protein [Phaeospirillum sp.]